jgi:uncharacterized protein YjbI with pentapeptide repeats
MANPQQLALLQQGVREWNRWKDQHPAAVINLQEADFTGADLTGANLAFTSLTGADFTGTDLTGANLTLADLQRADLQRADFTGTDLTGANLTLANFQRANLQRANLSEANLSEASLANVDLSGADLSGAILEGTILEGTILEGTILKEANFSGANLEGFDLQRANLQRANLQGANLQGANLQQADLTGANLTRSQVLNTDFTGANLSGACVADWQIGSSTILEGVQCNCIFRTYDFKTDIFSGRLPVNPESTFAPGEFERRFQVLDSARETIDITFTEGIDWQAFFQSFQAVRQQYAEQNIAVQGMEKRGEAFVVRLEVDTDETGEALEKLKGEIETAQKQLYGQQLAAIEAQYERQLRLQGAHLEDIRESLRLERQERGRLSKVVETMADQQKAPNIQINHSNIGNVVDTAQSGSRVQSIQHIYAPEQQDLSAAAQEIQALLNTLAETYNTSTNAGQEKLIKEASAEVQKHPKWRRALKEGGIELIKVLCGPIGIPLEMARVYLEE